MRILIKSGRVIDPKNGIDTQMDVLIENGHIAKVAPYLAGEKAETVTAQGLWVLPGFIDLHVHLRDPGFTYKETLLTGTRAAAAGGFTTVCAMPNTSPALDNAAAVRDLAARARAEGVVNVLPVGAVTVGQKGETLTDFAALKEAGVCALSEDGRSVQDESLMAAAFVKAAKAGLPIFSHCEDEALAAGGVMHKGDVSGRLGLPGICREAEDNFIARDIALSEKTGAKLHICHLSTAGGAALVREAPGVTAEVCPHHFTLTDTDIDGMDANFKMNPPLRTKSDVAAIIAALKDGAVS